MICTYYFSEPSANGNAMPKPSPIRPQPHSQQQQHQFKPQQHQQQTGATNKKPKEDQHQQLFDLIGQQQQQQQSANQQQQPAGPKPIPYLPGLTKAKQPEILQRLSVATGKDDKIKSLFLYLQNFCYFRNRGKSIFT